VPKAKAITISLSIPEMRLSIVPEKKRLAERRIVCVVSLNLLTCILGLFA
jgi:hypothetical protein